MITAVVTTHCRAPEIVARALNSVLNQTFRDIEIFLIDDSFPDYEKRDDVKRLAEAFSSRLRYIQHSSCLGACSARNTGLYEAKGEFIAFLDDDDEWLPDKIRKQIMGFDSDEVGLVYCNSKVIDDLTGKTYENRLKKKRSNAYFELFKDNFVGSASFPLIRTDALRRIGGFDVKLKAKQDVDAWLRLSKHYSFNYVDEPLAIYHVHNGDRISTNPYNKISGIERLIEKHIDDLKNNKSAYSSRLLSLVPYYAMINQFKKSFGIWIKAVGMRPWAIRTNILYLTKAVVCFWNAERTNRPTNDN